VRKPLILKEFGFALDVMSAQERQKKK